MSASRLLSAALAVPALVALAACTSEPSEVATPEAKETTAVVIPEASEADLVRVEITGGATTGGEPGLLEAGERLSIEAACLTPDGAGYGAVTLFVNEQESTAKELPCTGHTVTITMAESGETRQVQVALAVPEGTETAYAVGVLD
ncbi:hypothetical protein [Serinibacter salmoneus]|uniref:Secreted protein n=1 Tax=Serinibacter salmoneus TaxID=556530 RepID=A0A2A9CXL8_9MICO|nr:hypothetical protein [Serinibacter salmoneus]PFG19174.1 hypothetical protein ATL40_0731 [Serinibacter salmoneus]